MKLLEMMNIKRAKKESETAYAVINEDLAVVVADSWMADGKPIAKAKKLTAKDFDGKEGFKNGMEEAIHNMNEYFNPQITTLGEAIGYQDDDPFAPIVVTNELRWQGAAMILLPEVIKKIRNRAGYGHGFYVLPSSVHEVIAMPKAAGMSAVRMREMVRDINRQIVSPDEFLSDEVFWISEDSNALRMIPD